MLSDSANEPQQQPTSDIVPMSYKYESWVMELINLNSIWSCLIVINSNLHVDLWRWMKLGSIVSLRSPIGSYPSFRWTDSKSKSNRLSWKEKIHQKRTLDSVERFEGWNSENKVIIIETEACFGYVFAHTVFIYEIKEKYSCLQNCTEHYLN